MCSMISPSDNFIGVEGLNLNMLYEKITVDTFVGVYCKSTWLELLRVN